MVRAPRHRVRVTLASTCFATAIILAGSTAAAATDASLPTDVTVPPATELSEAAAITNGHGRYVVVGAERAHPPRPVAWVSDDGLTWESATFAEPAPGSHMRAITPTHDGFVAVGYSRDIDGADASRILAWFSPDGSAWEPAKIRRPGRRGLEAFPDALADGPAGPIALGSFVGQDLAGQRLWHSADGRTWDPVALPDVKRAIWHGVAGIPDGYILLGKRLWRSADGVTWEKLPGSPGLLDLAVAPDGTVVGIDTTAVWRSPDLVGWEQVWTAPEAWALGGERALEWIGWAGDRFMVTGRDYGACAPQMDECVRFPLLESADGLTWAQVNGPDGSIGIDSDTWLQDVASDGASTVMLGVAGGRPPAVWLME